MGLRRIGVFSGTFDPIHLGHISFGRAALEQCNLDMVAFMPERRPRGKLGVVNFEHRLHMAQLATSSHADFTVLTAQEDQFTVGRTLPQLQKTYSGAEIVLLIGSDVVKTFHYRWSGLDQLAEQVEFAICLRKGETEQSMHETIRRLPLPLQYMIVTTGHQNMSATDIRSGDMQGIGLEQQQYIQKHQLYCLA